MSDQAVGTPRRGGSPRGGFRLPSRTRLATAKRPTTPNFLRTGISSSRRLALAGWHRSASARAAVKRWAQPLTAVTPVGWLVLVGGLVLLVGGLIGGWIELVVIGAAGLLLGLVAIAWTLGRSTLKAELELDRRRVKVGDAALARVQATNVANRRLASSTIEVPVGKAMASFDLPALAKDEVHEEVFTIPTRRRGVITLGPVSSVRSDPLGLVRRRRSWSGSIELFVHPQTVSTAASMTGLLKDIEGITTHDLSSSDVAFHALRPYVPGDDRRAVHWRTTARVGRLMVRQFEETRRTHLLVVLSLDADDYRDADDFETAVSTAASLVLQAMREEREVSLVTHDGLIAARTPMLLLDALSGVESRPRHSDFDDLTTMAFARVPVCSAAALVTGSLVGAGELRRARASLPVEVISVAVRCDADAPAALRSLSNLTVIDISRIAELPAALRSLR